MNRLLNYRPFRWLVVSVPVVIALAMTRCTPSGSDGGGGTGTLQVFVTDKPYPFDLIESAWVTITEVRVRQAGVEDCDEECDDGLFCNGEEPCVDGECRSGIAPCAAGFDCDEDADACLKVCTQDSDCDDAAFCNGAETCVGGHCAAGAEPCTGGLFCEEDNDVCSTTCSSNSQCDDGLFCNGGETCVAGACVAGVAPCAAGQECEEDEDECDDEDDDGDDDDDDEDDDDGDDDDDDDEDGPWVVIFTGERDFNLVELRNGQTDLLTGTDVPAGTYDQMRLVVTEGEVTLTDGRVFNLTVPSGGSSGIKLHFIFEVEDGGQTQLLLDVDMSRAFQAIPSGHIDDPSTITGFHFRPSIAMRLINLLDAGSVSGMVTAAADGSVLAGVSVTAFDDDGEEVTSTSTAADGTYLLGGLATGTYRVEFSFVGHDDVSVENVSVSAGEETTGVNAAMTATAP